MTTKQTKFEAKVKSSLDKSVLALDKETHAALMSIRLKALEKQPPKARLNIGAWILNTLTPNMLGSNKWIPASAFALCALLTVFLVYNPDNTSDSAHFIAEKQGANHEQYEQITMLELLTQPEDLEAATDPDFYVWMEEVLATEDIDNAV